MGVLLGRGDGTFASAVTYGSGSYFALDIADVDGDGTLDLILANFSCSSSGSCISVMPGNGDGTFQTAVDFATAIDGDSVVVADLNGDNKPDIVTAKAEAFGSNDPPGTVSVLLNNPSSCASPPQVTVSVTPNFLWPPTGKMVPVTISGTITDTGCSITSATYAVTDEYGEIQPSGPITLGPGGAYSFAVLLQASRLGTDRDGRLYMITVSASNNAGKTGSHRATVIVPHDRGHEDRDVVYENGDSSLTGRHRFSAIDSQCFWAPRLGSVFNRRAYLRPANARE